MNPRERFVQTLTFGKPDRFFYDFGWPRKSTIEAWLLQGLPPTGDMGARGMPPQFRNWVGADPVMGLPIKPGILPPFEEKTIEERRGHRIWRDGEGIIMEDSGDQLKTHGFRTRKYLAHPVKTREDWVRLRDEHWDPHHPDRYPADWPQQAARLNQRTAPLRSVVYGPYWKARDFIGFENLSMLFYDNPSLVHEIMDYVLWFNMQLLDRALTDVQVDCIMVSEDMCYKHAMMISPQTYREFILPGYLKMAALLRSKGVPVLAVDSDGHNGQIIPLLIEAGFNAISPVEIAAHNDPVEYRKKYGKNMAFFGAIDKRELTTRDRVYREIMGKVPFLLQDGGYLPGVDHGVPPTVHLRGYLYMIEMLKALAERRPVPSPDDPLEFERQLGPVEKMWTPDMAAPDDEPE